MVHFPSLKHADYLLNYGVGYNVEFEKDFFRDTGLPTLAFDPTLKSISLIFNNFKNNGLIPFLRHTKNYLQWPFKEKKLKKYKIEFIEEGISAVNTPHYKTLAYHLEKYKLFDKKIILKIDIEGGNMQYLMIHRYITYFLMPFKYF